MNEFYFSGMRQRWEGEDVPAECDYIGCYDDIDRGLSFKCSEPGCDCGLFFCYTHQGYIHDNNSTETKPDSIEWLETILTDDRWEPFRARYPNRVGEYRELVEDY